MTDKKQKILPSWEIGLVGIGPMRAARFLAALAIGLVLLAVGGIGSLVCWILVLIKMFQTDKPLIGILGILCGLWAFIWGWMKSGSLGLKKIMMIWSVCIGLSIVGNVIYGGAMVAKIQSGEIQMPQPPPAPAP